MLLGFFNATCVNDILFSDIEVIFILSEVASMASEYYCIAFTTYKGRSPAVELCFLTFNLLKFSACLPGQAKR